MKPAEYADVPNLDGMFVEELEEYSRTIADKDGEVWEDIKHYVFHKIKAMRYRLDGYINAALHHEKKCDSIYQDIKEFVDW